LYNADWRKQGNLWSLTNGVRLGSVRAQGTRNYSWEVFNLEGGPVLASGSATYRIDAQAAVEELLDYRFTVEMEYVAIPGCLCGSCVDPTGKWLVSNRADTVNLRFDSEADAVAWLMEQQSEGG
jgi:hypothetical protein